MLLRKSRSHLEIYNELDEEVVNFFRVLRDPVLAAKLERLARLTPYARGEFAVAKPKDGDNEVERARKLLVRSYQGFSGSEAQYRNEKELGFRTPSYGAGSCIAKSFASWTENVAMLTERMRGVTIERLPALEVMKKYDKADTLFYVDPPYVHSTRRAYGQTREMYSHEMTDTEHEDLAHSLSKLNGAVILSGYDCALYQKFYKDWRKEQRMAKTNKNADKVETLWLNAACGQQGRLL